MKLSAKDFGLPSRTVLEQRGDTVVIRINRKSRIGMADGKKILEKARKIQIIRPSYVVALETTAPLCSKTKRFLEEEGIGLIAE